MAFSEKGMTTGRFRPRRLRKFRPGRERYGLKTKKPQNFCGSHVQLVPRGRLELPRHSALPPQDSVSTNSTTWAQLFLYKKAPALASLFFPPFSNFPATGRKDRHAAEKGPDPGLRHRVGSALRLTDAPSTDIVTITSAFREPDGGRAANPARSERKQR